MIRDILDRTDLAAVLTELTGPPTSGPTPRWRCCASDHTDEHPSVTMFRDRNGVERWKCWSGGHGGTAIDAVMVTHQIGTADAIRHLERRAGLDPTPIRPVGTPPPIRNPPARLSPQAVAYTHQCARILWTPAGELGRRWLHQRGLTDQVLADNLVGYDPGPHALPRPAGLARRRGITYPSFDTTGDLVYVQTRTLDPNAPTKYINPAGTHGSTPPISIPHQTPRPAAPLIVTEGVADALIAITNDHRAAAVLSATTTGRTVADALIAEAGTAGIVIAFDNDPAGRAGETQLLTHLNGRVRVAVLRLRRNEDLTDSHRRRPPWTPHTPRPNNSAAASTF